MTCLVKIQNKGAHYEARVRTFDRGQADAAPVEAFAARAILKHEESIELHITSTRYLVVEEVIPGDVDSSSAEQQEATA